MINMDKTEKKRGLLLTIWLILMLIANLVNTVYQFYFILNKILYGSKLLENVPMFAIMMPTIPFWVTISFGILSLLDLIFVIFLFKWRKWAFYGFIATLIIEFLLDFITLSTISVLYKSILSLLGLIILYLLLRPKWNHLE